MPLWLDPPRRGRRRRGGLSPDLYALGAAMPRPTARYRVLNADGQVVAEVPSVTAAVEWWVEHGSPGDYLEAVLMAELADHA